MAGTTKPVLMVNNQVMEDNKERDPQAKVELTDSGPMKIKGKFILNDYKREKVEMPEEVSLCMCGKSLRMPYCDDSHKK